MAMHTIINITVLCYSGQLQWPIFMYKLTSFGCSSGGTNSTLFTWPNICSSSVSVYPSTAPIQYGHIVIYIYIAWWSPTSKAPLPGVLSLYTTHSVHVAYVAMLAEVYRCISDIRTSELISGQSECCFTSAVAGYTPCGQQVLAPQKPSKTQITQSAVDSCYSCPPKHAIYYK